MSGEANVTFVAGVAAEQTEAAETAQPTDEREAAVSAVKAALKEEGKKAAKEAKESIEQDPLRPRGNTERGADGKFLSKPKGEQAVTETVAKPANTDEKDDSEEDALSLKRVLRERKQVAQAKAQQSQELQKQAQALREYEFQLRQREAQMRAESEKLARLRKDPARAIKENGWDPEEFIMNLAQEGTPEGQARRQQRERDAEIAELREWRNAQERAAQEQQQAYQNQRQRAYREQVENHFLSVALKEDKPHLSAMYKGHEHGLLAEADVIADHYRSLTGKEATPEDVAEYLEERAANWYRSLSKSQQATAPKTTGTLTQGNGTGRTLTPDGSSERRSLGTTLKDLDGDERLAAAREAVASAIHASGERT